MAFSALAAVIAAAASVQQTPPCQGLREPIIDIHIHSYDDDDGRFKVRAPVPLTGAPMTVTNGADHARATATKLKRLGVVRAIVSGGSRALDDRMIALDPARILPGFEVYRVPTPEDLAEIRARHAAGKLAMIGEVQYQYNGIGHGDPGLEPLWALAEELDVPIAVHSGSGPPGIVYRGSPRHRVKLGDPLGLEEVLVRHPKLKLVVIHAGYPYTDNMIALMTAYPQIYVDFGAIDWAEPTAAMADSLKRIIDLGFGKRILFGSDQMVWPEGIGIAVQRFRDAPYLTDVQRRDIFFDNAVRLFGWTDLQTCGQSSASRGKDGQRDLGI